ncbi:MAG: hypothetical protein IKM43_04135 [Clostridia bacterium]|nr:hypothetical protein [Clostridia bacterium]
MDFRNDVRYNQLHLYEKIWFLRGRFDCEILHYKNKQDVDLNLLKDISEELSKLAFACADMSKVVKLLELKFIITNLVSQVVNDLDADDYFTYKIYGND